VTIANLLQASQLETKLNAQIAEVAKLKQAIKERNEDIRGKAVRLHSFEQSEMHWKQENMKLQERL
jgi:uncharacterized protein (DUF3084 family)